MTPDKAVEIIRAEYEAHVGGGGLLSQPVRQGAEEDQDSFTGMEVFDLEPTESVNDGRFKLQTGKWG